MLKCRDLRFLIIITSIVKFEIPIGKLVGGGAQFLCKINITGETLCYACNLSRIHRKEHR